MSPEPSRSEVLRVAKVVYLAVPGVGMGLAMALMGAPVAGAVVAAVSAALFAIALVRYRRLRRGQDPD